MKRAAIALGLVLVLGCAPAPEAPEAEEASAPTPAETAAPESPAPEAPDAWAGLGEIPEGGFSGIDVSHHSGDVDWPTVLDGDVHFVYLKATEGNDAGDPRFLDHWRTLGELGVPRGAYHFYVTEDAPETQASFFLGALRQAGVGSGDLIPVVDVELLGHDTQPGLPERLETFLDLVEEGIGVEPMIYTGPKFWESQFGAEADRFAGHPLWVAEYGVDSPVIPDGFDDYTAWQWRGQALLDGVEHDVDLSRLHPETHLTELRIPERQP